MNNPAREAGDALTEILEHAAQILTRSLPPDGISETQAIGELLGLLDGPVCRIVLSQWRQQRERL